MKKRMFIILLITVAFSACVQQSLNYPSDSENNKNLNSLMTLKIGNNIIYLQDFVMNPSEIDSVTASSDKLICHIDSKRISAELIVLPDMEHFVDLKLWIKGIPYSVPCRKTDKTDYLFTFNPRGKIYKTVRIAGQMNDWVPTLSPDLKLNDSGLYQVKLNLSPGTYLYQMSLNGDQNHDANNPSRVDNGYGKFNSILQVAGLKDKYPVLHTSEFTSESITLLAQNASGQAFVYWQNYRLPDKFIKVQNGTISFKIPAEAKIPDRSFIRVWASNQFGVSNDILIPLDKGKVLTDAKKISRTDKHARIIYFMLVDRFKDGDLSNNHPMNRPDVNHKVDYWGGDLAGLQQKIDDGYFEKLGVNTLWISPLNQNPTEPYGYYAPMKTKFSGYHGYWPVSSSKVDFRFGSNTIFRNLVADAHKKDMNILLDYVAHHVHKDHPFYKIHPQYTSSLYLPDGTMNTERWNDHRLTTWFDTFLPTIDFSKPEVVDMMTDSAMYWIKEFNIDGFRHDACKHIPEQFWRELTYKIKKLNQGKNLYQIGETYGSPELISSYLTTGMLDGQFDFNVFDIANTTFAGVGGSDLKQVNTILNSSLYIYGNHNLMGNISGNHDKPRFMSYASGDLKFGEDSKIAAWQRNIGITDSTAYDKMLLMHTFNMTIPGIPVIYYGDEIGLTGANDPDSRRMMKFDALNNREKNLRDKVSVLTQLRKNNPVLMYGEFISILSNKDNWVYARKYFDKNAIIFINNSSKSVTIDVTLPVELNTISLKSTFNRKFVLSNRKVSIQLPAYSSDVLI